MKDLPMANKLSPEEQGHVEEIQQSLGKAKRELRQAMRAAKDLMDIQQEAGRMDAYAEAYGFWCALDRALSETHCAHSVGTKAMVNCFGDSGGPVVFGPGGGR